MYMYSAMADLAADLGDDSLKRACEVLWRDVTSKRMYVTAGLGPAAANEGFTVDYDLPNDTAYAETCASVALIFWAQRMLNLELDGTYADVMEQALYNGALSGLARNGTQYFYQNPLESDGSHTRWDWHPCPCCTMNVSRLVASIGGYFYSTGPDVVAVHLYGGNTAKLSVGGTPVRISQETDYPWSGKVRITVDPQESKEFGLKLRIPSWANKAAIAVNASGVASDKLDRGYVEIRRTWKAGDMVEFDLSMPVVRVYAHPKVKMDVGRVALKRGPLVYCLEQVDNGKNSVGMFRLPRDASLKTVQRSDLFNGIVTVVANGEATDAKAWDGDLYRSAAPRDEPAEFTAVPYYIWNNRGPNAMLVWIPE
jgi:uncharacterized protein